MLLSHFKEEARKDLDEKGRFKCMTQPQESFSFDTCVMNSAKPERLELETLLLESLMFSTKINEK